MPKKNAIKSLPLGVLFIAAFYVFGAAVLLMALLTNNSNVSEVVASAHGWSPNIGREYVLAIAALALILAYGSISLSRWGFVLAIAYPAFLCVISLMSGGLSFAWTAQPELQVHFGNLIWSGTVLVYLLTVRKRFFYRDLASENTR